MVGRAARGKEHEARITCADAPGNGRDLPVARFKESVQCPRLLQDLGEHHRTGGRHVSPR